MADEYAFQDDDEDMAADMNAGDDDMEADMGLDGGMDDMEADFGDLLLNDESENAASSTTTTTSSPALPAAPQTNDSQQLDATPTEEDDADLAADFDGATEGESKDEDGVVLSELPKHACRYCGIYNPASVAKCMSTQKWFCNSRGGMPASCIVQHLVRSRKSAVQLHKESPLGA